MRSVLAPSFFTFKYPGIPFLLALGFHIVLSAISFAQEPRITVYSSGRWCKYCNSLKNDLKTSGTVPSNFNFSGTTKIDGVDVEFVHLPQNGQGWPRDVTGVPAMRVGNDPVETVTAASLKTKIKEIKNSEQKEETDEEDGEDSDADPNGHSDPQAGDQTPTPTSEDGEPKPEPKPAPPPPPAPAPPAPPAPDGGGGGNDLGQMLSQALQGLLQGGGQGSEQQQQQQFNQQEEQFANDRIMEMVYGTQTAVSLKTAQALATEDALSEITSEDQTDDTNNQESSDTESADVALTPTALPTPAWTVDPMIDIL